MLREAGEADKRGWAREWEGVGDGPQARPTYVSFDTIVGTSYFGYFDIRTKQFTKLELERRKIEV